MNKAMSAPKEFITQYKLVVRSMICFTFVNWIILCLFLLSTGQWVVHMCWAAVYTHLLSSSKTEFCSDCAFEDLAWVCKVTSRCSLVCSFILLGNLKPCCLPSSAAVKIYQTVWKTLVPWLEHLSDLSRHESLRFPTLLPTGEENRQRRTNTILN